MTVEKLPGIPLNEFKLSFKSEAKVLISKLVPDDGIAQTLKIPRAVAKKI